MKEIIIPCCAPGGFLPCARVPVELFKWTQNDYRPHTEAFLCHDGKELKVHLRSEEKDITCRVREDNGPVWCER